MWFSSLLLLLPAGESALNQYAFAKGINVSENTNECHQFDLSVTAENRQLDGSHTFQYNAFYVQRSERDGEGSQLQAIISPQSVCWGKIRQANRSDLQSHSIPTLTPTLSCSSSPSPSHFRNLLLETIQALKADFRQGCCSSECEAKCVFCAPAQSQRKITVLQIDGWHCALHPVIFFQTSKSSVNTFHFSVYFN